MPVTKAPETPTATPRNPTDNIPGLEISWEVAEQLSMSDEFITIMQAAKKQYENVHALVITDVWHLVRSLSRREYRNLVQLQAQALTAQENTEDSPEAVQATLRMLSEDTIAINGTIYPAYNMDQIRDAPAGCSTTLHNTILEVSGYVGQAIPIKI